MTPAILDGYPVVIDVPVAWADMDAYGHVNNTIYFRWFESARIAFFEEIGWYELKERTGIGPILASTRCRFRIPLTYPDVVAVGARAGEVGRDRFVMEYVTVSRASERLAAEGDGLIVSYDYRALAKAELPAEVRERLAALDGAREG